MIPKSKREKTVLIFSTNTELIVNLLLNASFAAFFCERLIVQTVESQRTLITQF